jgi:sporulation-control protein
MVFKSFMRALGVGGPTIDAVLDTDRVVPGGIVTGTLHVRGGEQGRTATRAVLDVVARVKRKSGDDEYETDEAIAGHEIMGPIPLGGETSAPFRIELPPHTPVTSLGGRNFVWVRSNLDIPMQIDPADTDKLEVYPTQAQINVLEAMNLLGFHLYRVDIDPRSSWFGRSWVQEFEFRPGGGRGTRYDEVEIVFEQLNGNHVELLMQLDRRARGLGGFLAEMTGMDESWVRVAVDASSPQTAAAILQRTLG